MPVHGQGDIIRRWESIREQCRKEVNAKGIFTQKVEVCKLHSEIFNHKLHYTKCGNTIIGYVCALERWYQEILPGLYPKVKEPEPVKQEEKIPDGPKCLFCGKPIPCGCAKEKFCSNQCQENYAKMNKIINKK
jgi:hypothetical protein